MEVCLMTTKSALNDMEYNAAYAMLTCHANTTRLHIESDKSCIERAIKLGHESILEHINLTFEINGLSRACLQELARHRHISLSVESTRHTLKKQLFANGEISLSLSDHMDEGLKLLITNYLKAVIGYVEQHPDVPNDTLKYAMPECLSTNLIMTLNVRELRHIVKLRSAPAALGEFRYLACQLVKAIPEDYRYWVEDCLYNGGESSGS